MHYLARNVDDVLGEEGGEGINPVTEDLANTECKKNKKEKYPRAMR